VQVALAVQATQLPLLQTRFVPQVAPFVTLPLSVQTGAPVVHTIAPVRHGLPATKQLAPAVHAEQAPLLQTRFCPQTVPFACDCCVSVQEATPPEQVV